MSGFVRNHFTAGVAAAAATALVLSPTGVPAPNRPDPADAARSVELAASVTPLVRAPLSARQLETARAAIGRLDPDAARALPVSAAAPAPQNAASDWITAGYQWIQGWVNYGVALSQYVLQFIPYGYLIGAQIGIVYYSLITPIANSVVYDLINPVVNDPLNIWSYVNGGIAVGQATINALINTGIAEFNYFFGWLIPPIPPLPLAAEPATLKVAEVEAATKPVVEEPTKVAVAEPQADVVTTKAPDTTPTIEPAAAESPATEVAIEKSERTTTAGTVQAQGEVRAGTQTTSHQTTTAAEPTADAPAAVPSDPKSDTPAADEDETDAPEKASASPRDDKGSDDKGKDEKPATSD